MENKSIEKSELVPIEDLLIESEILEYLGLSNDQTVKGVFAEKGKRVVHVLFNDIETQDGGLKVYYYPDYTGVD